MSGIIRRHIQGPKRYQRYHQETYTMAKEISEVSSGDIHNGQKDIRDIIRRHTMAKKISEVSSGDIYNGQKDNRYHQKTDDTSDIFSAIVYVS
jgi:hypothetical protein